MKTDNVVLGQRRTEPKDPVFTEELQSLNLLECPRALHSRQGLNVSTNCHRTPYVEIIQRDSSKPAPNACAQFSVTAERFFWSDVEGNLYYV
jgi:hypothetical protein